MKLGMIGLGRMGLNMVKRLLQGGQEVVEDSREGRWRALQAIESGVAAPVTTLSLMQRFISQDPGLFANRMLAALRQEFGGHKVKTAQPEKFEKDFLPQTKAGQGSGDLPPPSPSGPSGTKNWRQRAL